MAKKKLNPLENLPAGSSSDEEVLETECGEEEEVEDQTSDDSSLNPPSGKKPKNPSAAVIPEKPSSSAAVSRHVPGLDSGSEKRKTKKVRRGSPAEKSGKKRSGESNSRDMHVKRAKKVSGEANKKETVEDTKKKSPFQRLWSESDEISLLKGMIDFKADKGKSPYEDMDEFYELSMKSISFEASKLQFREKIRMLRRKYIEKGKEEVESYSKPHEQECARLAEYIWGSKGMAVESGVKPKKTEKKLDSLEANGKEVGEEEEEDMEVIDGKKVEGDNEVPMHGRVSASDWFENSYLVRSFASFGVEEYSVRQRWRNVPLETKKMLEDKWKLLQAKEFGLMLQKAEFLREVSSVFADDGHGF